jgi:hypothetical protein
MGQGFISTPLSISSIFQDTTSVILILEMFHVKDHAGSWTPEFAYTPSFAPLLHPEQSGLDTNRDTLDNQIIKKDIGACQQSEVFNPRIHPLDSCQRFRGLLKVIFP